MTVIKIWSVLRHCGLIKAQRFRQEHGGCAASLPEARKEPIVKASAAGKKSYI